VRVAWWDAESKPLERRARRTSRWTACEGNVEGRSNVMVSKKKEVALLFGGKEWGILMAVW
jgi:hypothetical protein